MLGAFSFRCSAEFRTKSSRTAACAAAGWRRDSEAGTPEKRRYEIETDYRQQITGEGIKGRRGRHNIRVSGSVYD